MRDALKFEKRCQYFIGVYNKPLAIVAVCINNPDCSPARINR
jgi:hypothetical protein